MSSFYFGKRDTIPKPHDLGLTGYKSNFELRSTSLGRRCLAFERCSIPFERPIRG
jgi:hypothetical protein